MLPPDIRDWVPKDHIIHFIIETVSIIGLKGFKVNTRGSGSEQYSPKMMFILLVYCYATGRFLADEYLFLRFYNPIMDFFHYEAK